MKKNKYEFSIWMTIGTRKPNLASDLEEFQLFVSYDVISLPIFGEWCKFAPSSHFLTEECNYDRFWRKCSSSSVIKKHQEIEKSWWYQQILFLGLNQKKLGKFLTIKLNPIISSKIVQFWWSTYRLKGKTMNFLLR